jgi:hypothetical protein
LEWNYVQRLHQAARSALVSAARLRAPNYWAHGHLNPYWTSVGGAFLAISILMPRARALEAAVAAARRGLLHTVVGSVVVGLFLRGGDHSGRPAAAGGASVA